jgi:hypothetical protein
MKMTKVRQKHAKRLSEWIETASDEVVCYAQVLGTWATPTGQARERPWLPEEAKQLEEPPVPAFKLSPDTSLVRRLGTVPAIAFIESITGKKARCLVQVAGSELPVELPVRILDARGFKKGTRFLWWMSEDGSVAAEDIDDLPPNRLTTAEEAEAHQLYQEFRDDIASGIDWGMNPAQDR